VCVGPDPVLGQWPGEVNGVVRDALTDSPVNGASVSVDGVSHALTGQSGRYRLRGLAPGSIRLVVTAPGYLERSVEHTIANGRVDRIDVRLDPNPLELTPLEARAGSPTSALGTSRSIGRAEIAASGARTLGDAVRRLPGVVVVERGVGSAQTLLIRGSDADAVLVLVDGVPLNDPVSGEADLSTIPADAIRTARLHVGASSARFGPRAAAGVLEVDTGRNAPGWFAEAGGGSLGARDFRLDRSSVPLGRWSVGGAVGHREVGGDFAFSLPPEVGGGAAQRVNADQRLTSLQLSADRDGPTYARVRLGGEMLNRGLPGPGFGPSVHARQEAQGIRTSLSVGHNVADVALRSIAYVRHARRRFFDPDPPAGLPYDERSRLSEASVELNAARSRLGRVKLAEVGTVVRTQWITADALDNAPRSVTDLGAFASASFEPGVGGARLFTRIRLDRAGGTREARLSHALTLALGQGPMFVELSHRSAFSPPTLADQFFREGVGTRPNPDLRAERIPSEFELAARFVSARLEGGGNAYVGDVRDRIVWQPDFRFVWSPTNTDVRRRGVDVWMVLRPRASLALRGSFSHARITYDREGTADSVQLAYRPRNTGSVTGDWSTPHWTLGATAHFTGDRFPVPAPINTLPSFWSVDVSASRTWTRATWSTQLVLRTHRALDARDTLIFGFPDPGRTFTLHVRVRRGHFSYSRAP